MPKKLALFLLGVALAVGAFLLYQYFSGASLGTTAKPRVVTSRPVPTTLPMAFESRNEKGELEYLISAQRAEPIKDKDGNPIPGQFRLVRPIATFFDEKNGRTMEIRGDECNIVIDQGIGPRPASPAGGTPSFMPGGTGGGKSAARLMSSLRLGQLKGHVRLTLAAKPAEGAPATQAGDPLERSFSQGELIVHFDGDLEFDGSQEILHSPGKIFVRSEVAAFDGEGLTLAFNREARRVEYLRVEKGNTIIIRGVGAKALALAENTSTTRPDAPVAPLPAPAAAPATAPAAAVAATTPAKTAIPPVVYKLSLGQDVRAAVGESVMTSDRLYLLFMAARDTTGGDRKSVPAPTPDAEAAPAAAATETAPPKITAKVTAATGPDPDRPGPMPTPTANDLVVTWTGPMEMRPAGEQDLQLVNGRDVALEAVGAPGKPVEVRDARFTALAGRLWYHGAEQRIKLEPDTLQRVELTDPTRGHVVCREVSIFQADKRAELIGPGTLSARTTARANAPLTTIAWKEAMNLELAMGPDPKNPKKNTLGIRRALIKGADIHGEAFDLAADSLDVLVASAADGKGSVALEHLLATGSVTVNSYRRGAGLVAAGGLSDGLRARSLEIKATRSGATWVPSQLIAEGDASGWQYVVRNKEANAANPSAGLEKRQVATARLVADLRPKPRAATAPAEETGLGGMGQNFEVVHFLADNAVRIDILPPAGSKNPAIVATAHTLDAEPVVGSATLNSNPADPASLVEIAMGPGNGVKARQVLLDQSKETFIVPMAGQFTFTPPEKKADKQPTPMQITWTDRMSYDNKARVALFTGKPVAQVAGDRADLGQLSCEKLLKVQLRPTAAASGAADPGLAGASSLELDYIEADGKVDARGAQLAADNKLLTQLRLNTDKLVYRNGSRSAAAGFEIPGPGSLVVDNFRPDKPGDRASAAGQSAFKWDGSLVFDGSANAITFSKNVNFFFMPAKPIKLASGSLVGADANAPKSEAKQIHLTTNRIVATFAKPKESARAVESPIALGAGGNQELQNVLADGGAQLDVGDFQLTGGSLAFNVPTNTATAEGMGENPATAIRPGQAILMADQITWDMTKDQNAFSVKGVRGNIQQ